MEISLDENSAYLAPVATWYRSRDLPLSVELWAVVVVVVVYSGLVVRSSGSVNSEHRDDEMRKRWIPFRSGNAIIFTTSKR